MSSTPDKMTVALRALANAMDLVAEATSAVLGLAIDEQKQTELLARETGDREATAIPPVAGRSAHSSEKWMALDTNREAVLYDVPEDVPHRGEIVRNSFGNKFYVVGSGMTVADAVRATKCVNAMAGVPDPERLMEAVRRLAAEHIAWTENDGYPAILSPIVCQIINIAANLEPTDA